MTTGGKGAEPATHGDKAAIVADPRSGVWTSLSYAIFLAVSWTWCIGMYLPVLLIRDLGLWGWVIFAVPNILGAAAMAWALPDARAGDELVARHREACIWFSIITIAFHVFFIGWMVRQLLGPAGVALAALAVAATWAVSLWRRDGDRWCAAAALLLSLALAGVLLSGRRLTLPSPHLQPGASLGLIALAPVCIVGFFLCPYLDLTFHRVRRHTSAAAGRWAFGLGFVFFFPLMILFTLLYARPLAMGAAGIVATCVGIHMAVQSGCTIALHLREMLSPEMRRPHLTAALALGIVTAAALPALSRHGTWLGLGRSEIIYRIFMGFYGLVFPAYVWINMRLTKTALPSRQTRHARHLASLLAVFLAAPMFTAGFLSRQWVWLFPGVLIILLSRVNWRGLVWPARADTTEIPEDRNLQKSR